MSSPRWAAVARLSDGVVLAQAAQPTPLDAGAQATVARVLASGQIKPDTQLTVTIGEEHGHLHLSAGASCVFLLLAPQDYPRRAALRLLAELSGWAAQVRLACLDTHMRARALRWRASCVAPRSG